MQYRNFTALINILLKKIMRKHIILSSIEICFLGICNFFKDILT